MLTCLAAAVLWAGCWQKSVEPFYQAKDLAFNPALAGTWFDENENPDKRASWTFTARKDQGYLLEIKEADETMEYDVHWFRLGGRDYLDFFSRKRSMSEIPAHHLLQVGMEDGKVQLKFLSLGWVEKWLKAHPQSLGHLRVVDSDDPDNTDKMEFVLSAPTADLQKFILEHRDAEGFFDGEGILVRGK